MQDSLISQSRDLLQKLLSENSEIGIVIGEPVDLDKMAASLALYLSFYSLGKNVQVVSGVEPWVEISNLVGIDRLKKDFSGIVKKFIVSLPYSAPYNDEIEKVSYVIEDERLNINILGSEKGISFSEKDVAFIKSGSVPNLVFTIGVSDLSGVSRFVSKDDNNRIVNIDKDLRNSFYGDIVLVSSLFSSVSEIVGKLIQELSLPIDVDVAQNLLDGIIFATNNFSAVVTSPFAFEAAGLLLRNGAKRKAVNTSGADSGLEAITKSKKILQQDLADQDFKKEKPESDQGQVPSEWFTPKIFKGSSKIGE